MNDENEEDAQVVEVPSKSLPVPWTLGMMALVLLSSAIAFCCTCIPIGLVAAEYGNVFTRGTKGWGTHLMRAAWPIGIVVAIFVGKAVARKCRK